MLYKIKYTYTTGDSFGSNKGEGILDGDWSSLDVAKENLNRIKEHYDFYCAIGGSFYHPKTRLDDIRKEASTKPWFVPEYDGCLKLITDNGKEYQISAPWCGYFESLHRAEIIMSLGDDSYFER